MGREALVVQLTGWFTLALSVFQVISRSPWLSSGGKPLDASDAAPYGILCGMGLAVAGKALARIEAALEKRDDQQPR